MQIRFSFTTFPREWSYSLIRCKPLIVTIGALALGILAGMVFRTRKPLEVREVLVFPKRLEDLFRNSKLGAMENIPTQVFDDKCALPAVKGRLEGETLYIDIKVWREATQADAVFFPKKTLPKYIQGSIFLRGKGLNWCAIAGGHDLYMAFDAKDNFLSDGSLLLSQCDHFNELQRFLQQGQGKDLAKVKWTLGPIPK